MKSRLLLELGPYKLFEREYNNGLVWNLELNKKVLASKYNFNTLKDPLKWITSKTKEQIRKTEKQLRRIRYEEVKAQEEYDEWSDLQRLLGDSNY